MAKKQINYEIKAHFDRIKKQKGVTSKEIAEALQISRQTMSAMSWCLDEISVAQAVKMAEVLKYNPADFIGEIMERSKRPNVYNLNNIGDE